MGSNTGQVKIITIIIIIELLTVGKEQYIAKMYANQCLLLEKIQLYKQYINIHPVLRHNEVKYERKRISNITCIHLY